MGYDFNNYPWSTSATMHNIQYSYSGNTAPYYVTPAYVPPAPAVEMPETPLEWLQRRVEEVTDLAYAA